MVCTIKLRAAEAQGRVDLVHPVAGDVHPGVAGQADDLNAAVAGRDVHDHERVGVGLALVAAHVQLGLLAAGQAAPLVEAGHHDVQRPAGRRARGSRVHPAEVAVDVAGERPCAARGQHDQRGHRADGHQHGAPLPRLAARGDARHELLLRGGGPGLRRVPLCRDRPPDGGWSRRSRRGPGRRARRGGVRAPGGGRRVEAGPRGGRSASRGGCGGDTARRTARSARRGGLIRRPLRPSSLPVINSPGMPFPVG